MNIPSKFQRLHVFETVTFAFILQLCLVYLVVIWSALLCADYKACYQGVQPEWANCEGAEGRLKIMKPFLPDNPMIFEAGAFDGGDSMRLALYWPGGKIISFEPNPNQFHQYLEKASECPNMFGYEYALNTYNGFTKFYLCWGSDGNNPIYEGASSLLEASAQMQMHYRGPEITVPCVILDDWCEENGIDHFDCMWIDLEGFELQFFKSSPKILNTVKVIYTETNLYPFRKGITRFEDLYRYLISQGYVMIAHWYLEGLQGDAIFVRKELVKA